MQLAVPNFANNQMVKRKIDLLERSLGLRISRGTRHARRSAWGQAKALTNELNLRREFLSELPQDQLLEWEGSMQELANQGNLNCWDRIAYASLRRDVLGVAEFEQWQIATKLIRSSELLPSEVLAGAIEFAHQGRLVAAIYALRRFLHENKPKRQEAVQATCLVLAAVNDDRLRLKAHEEEEACRRYTEFQNGCVLLLLDLLGSTRVEYAHIVDGLERLENLLGQQGVHGHALAMKWITKQLPTLPRDGWLMEVGCSREIIEGQASTAQLAAFARNNGMRFAGIDLDPGNIRALQNELGEQGRRWLTGKGEQLLEQWDDPIAALYLDAYDFWHRNHSEIREVVYRNAYGEGINDSECQRMHLLAVREGSRLLVAGGVLAIDDTWEDAGSWEGKGAQAVPWLLAKGWTLLEAANRAVVFLKPAEYSISADS